MAASRTSHGHHYVWRNGHRYAYGYGYNPGAAVAAGVIGGVLGGRPRAMRMTAAAIITAIFLHDYGSAPANDYWYPYYGYGYGWAPGYYGGYGGYGGYGHGRVRRHFNGGAAHFAGGNFGHVGGFGGGRRLRRRPLRRLGGGHFGGFGGGHFGGSAHDALGVASDASAASGGPVGPPDFVCPGASRKAP